MDLLKRAQSLPIRTRKIILWLVVIIVGTGLIVGFVKSIGRRLKSFQDGGFSEELRLPSFEKGTEETPESKIEESIKKMEEVMKEIEEQIVASTTIQE